MLIRPTVQVNTQEEELKRQEEARARLRSVMRRTQPVQPTEDAPKVPTPASNGHSLTDVITGKAEQQPQGRRMREGWAPYLGAGATRIIGSLLSAPGLYEGAAVSGIAESLAQKIESPDPVDMGAVAIESGLGAVPFGSIVKRLKPALPLAKQIALNSARAAGMVEAGNMARRAYHEQDLGAAIPDTSGELLFDVGTSALGGALSRMSPRFDTFDGTPGRTVRSATDDLAKAIEGAAVDNGPRLVKPATQGGAYETAPTMSGLRVKAVEHPPAPAGSKGRKVEFPKEPLDYAKTTNAAQVDYARLPLEVQLKLNTIDAEPSRVPREWLDSAGNPVHPDAVKALEHEAIKKEAAKRKVLEDYYRSVETRPAAQRAKAEATADQEMQRATAGGTNVPKLEADSVKAQSTAEKMVAKEQADLRKAQEAEGLQQTRNENARNKYWEGEAKAADKVELARKEEKARAAVDREIEENNLKPDLPIVKETTTHNTPTGKRSVTTTLRARDEGSGVPFDDADDFTPRGLGGGGDKTPNIPKTDPKKVSQTVFRTHAEAVAAAAGSGKRLTRVQKMGRGKYRAILEEGGDEMPPTTAAPETPKGPAPSGAPAGDAGIVPARKPGDPGWPENVPAETPQTKANNAVASAEIAKEKPAIPYKEPQYGGPERRKVQGKGPEGAERRASVIENEVNRPPDAPPPAPVAAKPKPAPKKPSGGASVAPKVEPPKPTTAAAPKPPVPVITTRAEPPKPVGGPAVTPPKIAQKPAGTTPAKVEGGAPPKAESKSTAAPEAVKDPVKMHPVGSTVRAYGSEGTVLTHGPSGVRVKFTSGRMAKEQGKNGYFDVDPKHIESTTVPAAKRPSAMSKREIDAVTREDVQKWTASELDDAASKYKNDKRLQTILADERKRRLAADKQKTVETLEKQGMAPKAAETPAPAKAAEPAKPAKATKTKESKPTTEQVAEKVYGKTVKVNGGKEARANVIGELRKYKAEVEAADTPSKVAPINIEVENGPRYTIQSHQVDAALAKLEGSENLLDKSVKGTASIPKPTNWGPTEKPSVARQADADKLGVKPDITEHAEVVGPKAATKEFTPRGASVVRSVDSPAQMPTEARNAAMWTDPDGTTHLYVSTDANHLKRFIADRKAEVKQTRGKYAAKRDIKEGTLPEGKTWEQYLTENKFDTSKTKFAVIGEEAYKPIQPPPTGGGAKPTPKTGVRVAGKKETPSHPLESGAPAAPKTKAEVEAAGISEAKAGESASELSSLALKEKEAWDYYHDVVKPAVAEGKMRPEDLRAAGKAAGELKAQVMQAVKAAMDKGEPIPTYLRNHADAVVKKAETEAAKAKKMPPGRGPTNEDIAKMSPEEQEKTLQGIVERFKNQKGAISGELLTQAGLSVAGAAYGASQTPDDPLFGMLLGGAAGFGGPALFRTMYRYKNGMPNGPARMQAEKALGQQVKDWASGFIQVLPDYYRAAYLAKFPNLVLNAWAGPYGAATMGAIEHAMAFDKRGFKALNLLWNPVNWSANAKDYFGPSMREAADRVTDAMERGDIADAAALGKGALKKVVTAPAQAMTAGDIGARKILMKAGFSEPEARAITLTSEPLSGLAGSIGAFRKHKGSKGTVSTFVKLALPFYRTAMNQMEQSALRTPIGNMLRRHWNVAPVETKQLLVQSGITGVVGIGSFQMGYNSDPRTAPVVIKFLNNFTGPYGATASAMYLAGIAAKKSGVDNNLDALITNTPKGMMEYLRTGTPLPTVDFASDWIRAAIDLGTKGEVNLPYGTVPPPLSSKEKAGAFGDSALTRAFGMENAHYPTTIPQAAQWLQGDREWHRPTRGEYGPIPAIFSDKPALKPKEKTAYQLKVEQKKRELAAMRKAARESAGR